MRSIELLHTAEGSLEIGQYTTDFYWRSAAGPGQPWGEWSEPFETERDAIMAGLATLPPSTSYQDELVSRDAPRWAWDIIDETLAMDAKSKTFSTELRADILAALKAMIVAGEGSPHDTELSRATVDAANLES